MTATAIEFFFAWANADDEFDITTHAVEDEQIVSFSVEQRETEFAILSITIANPRVGLLSAGRKRWAFLSWNNGSSIEVLFKGRLVAIPSGINKELITLQFIARPDNYALQKQILNDNMKVLPYYDPVFISQDRLDDLDTVLEGYTAVWCVDRVTHEVVASDLISDIEEALVFAEADVPYDSVDINIDQPPIKKVHVKASVKWTQTVAGSGLILLKNHRVRTKGGQGLIGGWPKVGASLSGGYIVEEARAESLYANVTDQDFMFWSIDESRSFGDRAPPFALVVVSAYSATGSENDGFLETDTSQTNYCVINDNVVCDLTLGYAGARQRVDVVEFNLLADSQPIVTDPADDDVLELEVNGNDVGLPLPNSYEGIPIGDVQRRSYFTQDRGQNSLQYLLQLARANIIVRSRAVQISFKCSFARAIELSLRHSVQITDPRLPGGVAVGKVVGYAFKSTGGEISGNCTIACAIGYGGAWTEEAGTPSYVEEDTVELGLQAYDGQTIILGASDVAFEPLVEDANDDGLIFPLSELPIVSAPVDTTVETIPLVPLPANITTSMLPDSCGDITNTNITLNLDTGPYNAWLGGITQTVDFSLKPITGGPFETTYTLVCTELKLPQQINLEAT